MNIQEIRALSLKDLFIELKKNRDTLFKTKFHVKTSQEKNTAKVKKHRLTIARIKTEITQKKQISLN